MFELKEIQDDSVVRTAHLRIAEAFGDEIIHIIRELNLDIVIFGVAVRDSLANVELVGDLDLLSLNKSAETLRLEMEKKLSLSVSYENPYEKGDKYYEKWGKIEYPIDFNYNDKRFQLVMCKTNERIKGKEAILRVASDVDLRCCGLIMTLGEKIKIFETVKYAYEDCLRRELHLTKPAGYSYNIRKRISKLVSRGWENKTGIEGSTDNNLKPIEW